jgi:hypothetical protein
MTALSVCFVVTLASSPPPQPASASNPATTKIEPFLMR